MRIEFWPVVCLMVVVVSALPAADDPTVYSGPQSGEKLPELKVSLVYGEDASKTVDLIELAAGRPTLIVVVNGPNRPAANLTRCLMNYAEMVQPKLFAAVVYLDSDPSAAEQYLRQATSWWGVGTPVGLSIDGGEGPGSYGLNRNVNLTVLVANQGVVTSNFPLVQPSAVDAPKIFQAVVEIAGGRVPNLAESIYLSMPTRKPATAPYPATSTDVQLRQLICAGLAASDRQSADKAASDIESYVQDSPTRQAMLGNTAAALTENKGLYANDLRDIPLSDHLLKWRHEYGPTTDIRANRRGAKE